MSEVQHRYELQMYTEVNGVQMDGARIYLGYFDDYHQFKGWATKHGWLPRNMPEWNFRIWEDEVQIKGTVGEVDDGTE